MTRSDKWKKRPCVVSYFNYCNNLRYLTKGIDLEGEINALSLVFILPMPKSWTKKKRAEMQGKPHKQRPDLSNLIKAFEDALWKEDSHISEYGSMKKAWGRCGAIWILNLKQR